VFDILAAEVIEQCDPQDELIDSIISDPQGCSFNPTTLACNAKRVADECLTSEQLSTLYQLYNDRVDVIQTLVYGFGSAVKLLIYWVTSGSERTAPWNNKTGIRRVLRALEMTLNGKLQTTVLFSSPRN
jgi:hypothetical protein